MHRKHALVIAVLLGLAMLLGSYAAIRTAAFSTASATSTNAVISARQQRLDRAEQQLKAALARKPPALSATPVPASRPVAQKVEYVRPAPIVITRPSAHREDDGREHESGHEDEHEGADD